MVPSFKQPPPLYPLLAQVFATPKRHHKSKPFFDHVISFSLADGRIWLRNYQVGAGCWAGLVGGCWGV